MKKIFLYITIVSLLLFSSKSLAQQCAEDEKKAKSECSEEQFTKYKAALESVNKKLAGAGAGTTASESKDALEMQKRGLDSTIALCEQARSGCIKSCQQEAAQKRSEYPPKETEAQRADSSKQTCEAGDPKKAQDNAKGTSEGMGEAMKALAGLMAALGMKQQDQKQPEQPLCTQNPNDPSCKTDVASKDNSQLATGEFRRDDSASLEDGMLEGQADPTSGPAAAPTSSGAIAGAASAGLGGGGGGGSASPRGAGSGDKKSDFDGSPKINLAGGAMGGGGGGGGGRGGGSSGIGKSGANPTASRTGIDGDPQAGKIAAAAEERLRGPASNEPLGGVTSVYYLDNFSKVEKRMLTERNTLQEH